MTDASYLLKCPIDIIGIICEYVCRVDTSMPAGIHINPPINNGFLKHPRANREIVNFMLTCRHIKNIAYTRTIRIIFNNAGWLHVCRWNLCAYYSLMQYDPTPKQFADAVSLNSTNICRQVINKIHPGDSYCINVIKHISGGTILRNVEMLDILFNLNKVFIKVAWTFLCSRELGNINTHVLYNCIRAAFSVRGALQYDIMLNDASVRMYRSVFSEDMDLAFEMLVENMHDMSKYVPAMKILFRLVIAEASRRFRYPWLSENEPIIRMLHAILNIHVYTKEWLIELILVNITTQYHTYINVYYNLNTKMVGIIDETTMMYYLDNVYKVNKVEDNAIITHVYENMGIAIMYNAELMDCIFARVSIRTFTLKQLYDIARLIIDKPIHFVRLFQHSYFNPLLCCDDLQIEFNILEECHSRGYNADDTAVILMYAIEEAHSHRALTRSVLDAVSCNYGATNDILHNITLLNIWYKSRVAEQWTPAVCIPRYQRELDDAAREAFEIERERTRICLNWSQDVYDVAEWYSDPCDEYLNGSESDD